VQLEGTAMGTPAAPLYAILMFGFHKNTHVSYTTRDTLMISSAYGLIPMMNHGKGSKNNWIN
jgi:hypothetical protein